MPSTDTMLLFAIASAGLVAIPGPAVIYIVTRGVVTAAAVRSSRCSA